MTEKRITYRGMQVTSDWPSRIESAQKQLVYFISGQPQARVRYGSETDDWGADSRPCRDCGAIKGELHVRACDVERCPVCGGQAIGCDCEYDEVEA